MTLEMALQMAGIPRLDAEVLLAHTVRKNRTWIMSHSETELTADEQSIFEEFCERRKMHEPTAYITQQKEFFSRSFFVDARVLIPRPATETLVELVLDVLHTHAEDIRDADTDIVAAAKIFGDLSDVQTIVDVGTGSGCIAITLALENPNLHIIGTDSSKDALAVAAMNRHAHEAEASVELLEGNLLEAVQDLTEPFLLVSNLPYIPSGDVLEVDVSEYEPHSALFSGEDGMHALRVLWRQAQEHPACRGIVLECRKDQWQRLLKG